MKNVIIAILFILLLTLGYVYVTNTNSVSEPDTFTDESKDNTFQNNSAPIPVLNDSSTAQSEITVTEFFLETDSGRITSGDSVRINGLVTVPKDQQGRLIVFFGDGVSDLMFRKGPTTYEEVWNHVYDKPGQYEAILVFSDVNDVNAEFDVMKDYNHPKNTILGRILISVN